MINMEVFAQVLEAPGHSFNRKNSGSGGVPVLFVACLPLNITRKIPLIIVDPSNASPRRSDSDIFEKVTEVLPPVAHGYSPITVMFKQSALWIRTALPHIRPRSICRSPGKRMYWFTIRSPTAPAISRHSLSKSLRKGDQFASAFATAEDSRSRFTAFRNQRGGIRNNFQLPKCASDKRYSRRHGIGLFNVVFSGGRSAVTDARCDNIRRFQRQTKG